MIGWTEPLIRLNREIDSSSRFNARYPCETSNFSLRYLLRAAEGRSFHSDNDGCRYVCAMITS